MRMTGQMAVLVALAMAATACTREGQAPEVKAAPAGRPATIPLATYAGLLRQTTVSVAGSAHPFIFDTGGGETIIGPAIASAIGCQPYGRAVGFRSSGEQVHFAYCDDVVLRIGGVSIEHQRVGVFDLQALLPDGLPPADGIVSLRSFYDGAVTVDLARGEITVETAESLATRTSRMQPLTVRIASGPTGAETTVYVAARVGGQQVWLLLDSGNGDAVLVAPHVARAAGLEDGRGEIPFDFEGTGPVRLPVRTADIIYDGMLGADFMRHWVFTLALASGRAWISPANSPGA